MEIKEVYSRKFRRFIQGTKLLNALVELVAKNSLSSKVLFLTRVRERLQREDAELYTYKPYTKAADTRAVFLLNSKFAGKLVPTHRPLTKKKALYKWKALASKVKSKRCFQKVILTSRICPSIALYRLKFLVELKDEKKNIGLYKFARCLGEYEDRLKGTAVDPDFYKKGVSTSFNIIRQIHDYFENAKDLEKLLSHILLEKNNLSQVFNTLRMTGMMKANVLRQFSEKIKNKRNNAFEKLRNYNIGSKHCDAEKEALAKT